MTTINSLRSRVDRLETSSTDDGRFALELAPGDDVELAMKAWRKTHRGQPPLMVLILPTRAYEPLR